MQRKPFLGAVVAVLLLALAAFVALRREFTESPVAAAVLPAPTPTSPAAPGSAAAASLTPPAGPPSAPAADRATPPARFSVAAIPTDTALHRELAQLAPEALTRALTTLESLTCGIEDAHSLHTDSEGSLYYACMPRVPPSHTPAPATATAAGALAASAPATGSVARTPVPVAQPPLRHSRPGATAVLYLDFNGHVIKNTAWNKAADERPAVATYDCPAFDTDGDPTTFNDAEQAAIIEIWERVSEDYAPFAIDVTTEEPASFGPRTARAVITSYTDRSGTAMPASDSGGVAYLDVFGRSDYASYYSPALAYYDRLYSYAPYIAEAISHEVGHNFSLNHDGISGGEEYYGGHGSGDTSWAPLMGNSYNRNVSQWSKGEYTGANNTQDDVQLIGARTGFGTDDVGNTIGTATPLSIAGFAVSASGCIGSSTDSDLFAFTKQEGPCSFTATPYRAATGTAGGNSDLVLTLLNATGNAVAMDNPDDRTTATVSAATSPAGTYYLKVSTSGAGAPQAQPATGYTVYGSLGRYTITGQLPNPLQPVITGPVSGNGTFGEPLEFWITVDKPVTSYQATGLPTGVSVDSATGRIFGTPQHAGTFRVNLTASGPNGTAQAEFTLTIAAAPPIFTSQPAPRTIVGRGEPFTLNASCVGAAYPPYYSLYRNGEFITSGNQPLFQITGSAYSDSGWYQIVASDNFGIRRSDTAFVAVAPADAELRHFGGYPFPEPSDTGGLIDVAAGRSHALALRRDGTVVSWGDHTAGQLEQPADLTAVVAIAAGDSHSIALRADGTVRVWGGRAAGGTAMPTALAPPAGLRNVVAIAARGDNCMALRGDGTVAVWGLSAASLQPPAGLSNGRAIALGRNHAIAIVRPDYYDEVKAWGDNSAGQTTIVSGADRPLGIAAGDRVTLSLSSAKSLVAWNDGPAPSRLGVGAPSGDPMRTAVLGDIHGVALAENGTVRAWSGDAAVTSTFAGIEKENSIFRAAAGYRYTLLLRNPADFVSPSIIVVPHTTEFMPDSSASFSVLFTGSQPMNYRWQTASPTGTGWSDLVDDANCEGATTQRLLLRAIPYERKGWQFRCVASNSPGTSTVSPSARLQASLSLVASPMNTATNPGGTATFSARFLPDAPDLQYRWQVLPAGSSFWSEITDGPHYRNTNQNALEVLELLHEFDGCKFRCIATGPYCSTVITGEALLSVANGWTRFRSGYFSAADLADPAISGETADPDGDGIPNLLEYAFGLNPKAADPLPLLRVVGVANYFQLAYTPASGATDLIYTLQSSVDLRTWTDVPGGSTATNQPVSVDVPGTATVFYRVAVRFR